MATRTKTKPVAEPEYVAEGDVSSHPDDWEWDAVTEESPTRVVFDTIGDQFVGQFIGEMHVQQESNEGEDESFDLYTFRGRDGKLYAVNKSWKIEQGMEKVAEGDWIRMRYVADIPTKRNLNPMKDIVIDVRR